VRRLLIAVLALAMLVAACDRIVELERQPPPDGSNDAINDAGNGDGIPFDGDEDGGTDGGVAPDA